MDEIDCAWEHVEAFTKGALHAALARKDSRRLSTGTCTSCAMPIEQERLAVTPHAQRCRDCAAEEEEVRLRMRRCGPTPVLG